MPKTMAIATSLSTCAYLRGYQYKIVYRPGSEQGNADGLSRLPLPTTLQEVPQPAETVLLMERLNSSLVTAAQTKAWTDKDQSAQVCAPTLLKTEADGSLLPEKGGTECRRRLHTLGS